MPMIGHHDFDPRLHAIYPDGEQATFWILNGTQYESFGCRARVFLSRYVGYPVASAIIIWYDAYLQPLEDEDLKTAKLVEVDVILNKRLAESLKRSRAWCHKAPPFYRIDRPDGVFRNQQAKPELIKGRQIAPMMIRADARAKPMYPATDWASVCTPGGRRYLRLLPDELLFDRWCRTVYLHLLRHLPTELPVTRRKETWLIGPVDVTSFQPGRALAISGDLGDLRQAPILRKLHSHDRKDLAVN